MAVGINKGLNRYKRIDNAIIIAGGNLGHTVCTAGNTVTGRFSSLIPYDGLPTISAISVSGDDIPSGQLMSTLAGDFTSVSCTSGTVLCTNGVPENI